MATLDDLREAAHLISDLADLANKIVYYPPEGTIYKDVDPGLLTGGKTGKELKEFMQGRTQVARHIYNPYWTEGPFGEKDGLPAFNIYCPPNWRHRAYFFGELVEPCSSIPPLIDRFIKHFVAYDGASEEFILDWLSNALYTRNGTYLCILSKIQGTGKGVLGEMCRTIYGEGNVTKVRGDALNSRFNAQFANAQIVHFDEFNFKDNTALDRAKDLVNAKLEVEKKGKDAIEMDNHLNGLFVSNRMGAITEEGRRFSIPITSDVQLKTTFSTEEIRQLQYDTPMIERFARYLWYREVKRDMWFPFISARTKEVRDYGLTEWESLIVEEFLSKCPEGAFVRQSILNDFIKKRTSIKTIGRVKWAEFASKFKEHMKHARPLDPKTKRQGEWGILMSQALPDFQPGFWCEICQNIAPEGCTCRRDP